MNYRLVIYPAIEEWSGGCKEFFFDTANEMIAANNTSADLLLFIQDELSVMDDYSNIFIMSEKVNGEWIEFEEGEE